MHRAQNSTPDSAREWPGAPLAAGVHPPLARTAAALSRAYKSVFFWEKLRKLVRYAASGKLRLAWKAFCDLASRRIESELPVAPLRPGQPLVSVVIPCFNYGKFIGEAVDSILGQTLKNVEVIVVDGGSTDKTTRELLANFQRPRTVVHLREGRHYVGSNRNFGIERASGRYICCLDADDTVEPTYLEKAVFLLETYGYDCVSTALRFTGARQGTYSVCEHPDLATMMRGNQILTCAVFRRCLWARSHGFIDTGLGAEHVFEDWDFWIQLAAQGARMRNFVDEPHLNYRVHAEGSLSSAAEVRPKEEHRRAILQRHAAVLTRKQLAVSAAQQKRSLRCATPGGVLTDSFIRIPNSGPTLLIALPFLLIGGAERLLSSLTGYLVQKGWQVVVVTTKHRDPVVHGESTGWFTRHTPEVYQLPKFIKPHEWHDFLKYLLNSRRPDCVLIAGSRFTYESLPEVRRSHPDVAIVDLLFNTSGHVRSHEEFRACFTGALAENLEVMNWLQSIGWPPSRIRQVKNGVDTDRYRPRAKSTELMDKFGIRADDLVVGFSGRMSKEKAPELFIEIALACASRSNICFLMIGMGPLAKSITRMAAAASSKVRLTYVGKVDDVESYLGLCDLLVLPSRLDGRPMAAIEALSMGVPVIASRVGGLPELVIDGENGYLCPPSDVAAFADRILQVADDPAHLARMRTTAREFALEHLRADQMLAAYENALLAAIQVQREALDTTTARREGMSPSGPVTVKEASHES